MRAYLTPLILLFTAFAPQAAGVEVTRHLAAIDDLPEILIMPTEEIGGVEGQGIAILIFEGVGNHPDLECLDTERSRFGPLDPVQNSTHWEEGDHGTHIAGVICSTGETSGGRFRGVAPGAQVVSFGPILLGAPNPLLEPALESGLPVRVISHSMTGNPESRTMKWLAEPENALIAWSAGNDGDTTPPVPPGHERPANLLIVGSVNRDGTEVVFSSSKGIQTDPTTWPDIVAFGCPMSTFRGPRMTSHAAYAVERTLVDDFLDPGYLDRCAYYDPAERLDWLVKGYGQLSGTSFAAPAVAGIGALVLQVNPALNGSEVATILKGTAKPFMPYQDQDGDGNLTHQDFWVQHGWAAGWGMVNAPQAVRAAHVMAWNPNATASQAISCVLMDGVPSSTTWGQPPQCPTAPAPSPKPLPPTNTSLEPSSDGGRNASRPAPEEAGDVQGASDQSSPTPTAPAIAALVTIALLMKRHRRRIH